MRIAFLGDIHSNHIALKKCYDYIENNRIDEIVYLGDYVSNCAYPQKTMKLIYDFSEKYKSSFIIGNREQYLLEHHESIGHNANWKYSSNTGSLLYTYENLKAKDLDFFSTLPMIKKFNFDENITCTVCHSSPNATREALFAKNSNTKKYLNELDTKYLICAHTHEQIIYKYNSKIFLNAGSVGVPCSGEVTADFLILDIKDSVVKTEFISLNYDAKELLYEYEQSGLNIKGKYWIKALEKQLKTGINYSIMCINLAEKYAKENEKDIPPFDFKEMYWERAAKDLNIY
ncbi:MAG: metallophosphoesterase family protein [Clostridia bacterium]